MALDNQNMQSFMEQAKEMQKNMQEMQETLTGIIVVGSAGGNLVKVHMNCAHRLVRVEISPTLFSKDEDMLEDLIVAAGNDAEQKIEETVKQQMMEMAKRMKVPEGWEGGEGGDGKTGASGIQTQS